MLLTSEMATCGDLVGTDHGEWSGELTWIPKTGRVGSAHQRQRLGMDYDNDCSIVLFGLAHLGFNYGYALKVNRNARGAGFKQILRDYPVTHRVGQD
jgi:hypothetical protein